MNDLLAVLLVGLVVLTAVVSVLAILSGPVKPLADADFPESVARKNAAGPKQEKTTVNAGKSPVHSD